MIAATRAMLTGNKGGQNAPQRKRITLHSIVAVLFAVKLRESLDAKIAGDKSDAAWTWGL